ncbi:hypothetical protein MPSEU_000360300 [Mayamaea pseudoterrestris]|nr:hypothetical protein MPSEU_000360300 [Mayamaea pseudoterrestris]
MFISIMSGRLVILPKKSYCPWKPENLARVERDERMHAEQLQQQNCQRVRKRGHERMDRMRNEKSRGGSHGTTITSESPQHVNLFRREEDEAARLGGQRRTNTSGRSSRLTAGTEAKPFYIEQPVCIGTKSRSDLVHEAQHVLKTALDPASTFMSNDTHGQNYHNSRTQSTRQNQAPDLVQIQLGRTSSLPKHDERRRRRRKHGDDESVSNIHKETSKRSIRKKQRMEQSQPSISDGALADLRRRRMVRESDERERQETITTSYGYANGRNQRKYNDQFHPSLAR